MKKFLSLTLVLLIACSLCFSVGASAAVELPEPPEDIVWEDWDIEDGNIYGYYGDKAELTVPSTDEFGVPIKIVYSHAFMGNTTLKNVVVQEGIEMLDGECFRGCTALETVVLPQSVYSFSWGNNFVECTNLKSINLPAALEVIPPSTFAHCNSLTEIIITYGIKEIQLHAFDSTSLEKVVLPETVSKLSYQSFSNLETKTEFELTICNPNCDILISLSDSGLPKNILGARNDIKCRVIGQENSTASAFYAHEGMLPITEFVAKPASYFENLRENQEGYGVDIGVNGIKDYLPWIIIGAVALVILIVGVVVIIIVVKKSKAKNFDDDGLDETLSVEETSKGADESAKQ